ncbi:sulfite exporter TauE/SafE family protein [Amycolatopsis endophytica]|uniref:Probable membrane transporter protein n=1 Tax=Amycolatopsis endophytica TaxID=860233 RepID=A0A853B7Y5_9PSEU|nr:TSUP family transporter [Amycolatopsis endophytica]NYI90864.1 hypothetical protein [Amycolatopsis endophytica]
MSTGATILVVCAVLAGALTQRATGLGFALVAAPFLVVIAGPETGVSLGNTLSAMLCAVVLARTWRHTWWRQAAALAVPAAIAVPLGALVVHSLPAGPLLVLVGAMGMAAVAMVVVSGRRSPLRGRAGLVTAGSLSGFMNVTAGVGGPMVTAYALSQGWSREVFVPTVQVYLLFLNVVSVATKGLPVLAPGEWALCSGALLVGVVAGELVNRRLTPEAGRRFIIAVALAGGAAAVIRGAVEW